MTGWIGNFFLLWGHVAIGNRLRRGFVYTGIGEVFWLYRSWQVGIWDGIFLCTLFTVIQIRNWVKWK